jgi:hypothetical protein
MMNVISRGYAVELAELAEAAWRPPTPVGRRAGRSSRGRSSRGRSSPSVVARVLPRAEGIFEKGSTTLIRLPPLKRVIDKAGELFFRAPFLWVALLAVALTLPALTVELHADDFRVRDCLTRILAGQPPPMPWWELGALVDGNPANTIFKREQSLLPWWTLPDLRVASFRPVALLTMVLDYLLWPDAVWAMHLHSILWYGLACFMAGLVFRRVSGGVAVAALAALLYAVDDMHVLQVAWISKRSGPMAACLAFGAFLLHVRWRADGFRPGAILSPLLLLLALLTSELSICITAYLAAYALTLDRGSPGARVASLIPAALTVAAWRIPYNLYGYGSTASGFYLDPVRQPLAYLSALPERLGTLLSYQFGLSAQLLHDLYEHADERLFHVLPALIGIGVLLLLYGSGREKPELRFWAVGLLLACIPMAASWPSEQVMVIAGIGGNALVAHLLLSGRSVLSALHRALGPVAKGVVGLAFVIHLIISPVCLSVGTASVGRTFVFLGFAPAAGVRGGPELADQDMVVLNAPNAFHAIMIQFERFRRGLQYLGRNWVLGSSEKDIVIKRIDDHTLELRAEGGYLADPFASHFRGPGHPFSAGDEVRLLNHTVTVSEVTGDGRPLRVRVRFDLPLTDPTLHHVAWDGEDYAVVELPARGGSLVLREGRYRRP